LREGQDLPLPFLLRRGVTEVLLSNRVEGGSGVEELGQRLRSVRLENGWSRRATAERLGVSILSITRWEAGGALPKDTNRYKIAWLLESGDRPSSSRVGRWIVQLSLFPGRIPSAVGRT
jgi:DNA-binding XRE family transcriptional regulator